MALQVNAENAKKRVQNFTIRTTSFGTRFWSNAAMRYLVDLLDMVFLSLIMIRCLIAKAVNAPCVESQNQAEKASGISIIKAGRFAGHLINVKLNQFVDFFVIDAMSPLDITNNFSNA